jgi:6-phosphogluconolactonase
MEPNNVQHSLGPLGAVSRRSVLKSAVVLAASRRARAAAKGIVLAYVGTYTPNGQGIHRFQVDLTTGALTQPKIFPSTTNPSWIAFDPTHNFLYAGNEISNFSGTTTGSVTAYSVNQSNGDLTALNTVTSGGSGPAHLSVDPLGKFVFVANYGGGNVAVIPIQANGSLANPTDVVNDTTACSPACALGPTHAAKAPPGSFAISGHDAPHAHMIQADPAGNYVIANDLGLDLTIVWKLDRTTGKLTNHQKVPSSAGAGPRHFAFHPNGRWFYSINEEASTLTFMTYDAATGTLTPQTEISTLPRAFVGTNFTSEVIVSRDGRFVYGCNRLHDTVAIFAVDGSGRPALIGEEWTRGDYPRNCNIDPTGNYLYACNHRGDSVTIFRINDSGRNDDGKHDDGHHGHLRFTGQYVPVGSPAVITFLTI